MITARLSSSAFPRLQQSVRASWCPIYLEPVMGSAERFIIAVAAMSDDAWHVEPANALDRLECLYGKENGSIIAEAARTVIIHLEYDLQAQSVAAFDQWQPPISGAAVGPSRTGEGGSLQQIAASWMSSLSSLYIRDGRAQPLVHDFEAGLPAGPIDRLPGLVFDYVEAAEPRLTQFFRSDLRDERRRRNHEVSIDFAGSLVAANFGTLRAGRPAASVDFIKNRLWDLKVDRDQEGALVPRRHEMLVQVPSQDDPQVTARQHSTLKEARDALEEQADQENIRFETFSTVEEIGRRLTSIELATHIIP